MVVNDSVLCFHQFGYGLLYLAAVVNLILEPEINVTWIPALVRLLKHIHESSLEPLLFLSKIVTVCKGA